MTNWVKHLGLLLLLSIFAGELSAPVEGAIVRRRLGRPIGQDCMYPDFDDLRITTPSSNSGSFEGQNLRLTFTNPCSEVESGVSRLALYRVGSDDYEFSPLVTCDDPRWTLDGGASCANGDGGPRIDSDPAARATIDLTDLELLPDTEYSVFIDYYVFADEFEYGCLDFEICFSGELEICGNGIDDDCDLVVDEVDCLEDLDGDGAVGERDCVEGDPSIYEGAREHCDGLDNDCDGTIDDDRDQDGHGDLCDNCPDLANSDQLDGDKDGLGNACDPCPAETLNECYGAVATNAATGSAIRVNTGSDASADCSGGVDCRGLQWIDDYGTPTHYTGHNGSVDPLACDLEGGCPVYTTSIFGCVDSTLPSTAELFRCQQSGLTGASDLSYRFEVLDGEHLVNLLFMNPLQETTAAGSRVFDVSMEERLASGLVDFDPVVAAGELCVTGQACPHPVSRAARVDVSHGLSIDFHGSETSSPIVAGIEVLCKEQTYFLDNDQDGLGDPTPQVGCGRPSNTVLTGTDCDDGSKSCGDDCSDVDMDGVFDCKDSCIDADADGYGFPAEGFASTCLDHDCHDADPDCTTACVQDETWLFEPSFTWEAYLSAEPGEQSLTSPLIEDLTPHSRLIFHHVFNTEIQDLGGVLEFSVDDVTWFDAGGLIVHGVYNSIQPHLPWLTLSGRESWSAAAGDVVVDLSSLAGSDVRFRWRLAGYDDYLCPEEFPGWSVGDIRLVASEAGFMECPEYPGYGAIDGPATDAAFDGDVSFGSSAQPGVTSSERTTGQP